MDTITIYAMKFSTYAIGYTEPEKADNGGKEPDSGLITPKGYKDNEPQNRRHCLNAPLATTGMTAGSMSVFQNGRSGQGNFDN